AAVRRAGGPAGGPRPGPRGNGGRAVHGAAGAPAAVAVAAGPGAACTGAVVLWPVPRRQPLRPAFRALPGSARRAVPAAGRTRRVAAAAGGRLRGAAGAPRPRRRPQLVQLLRLLERR